jgi:hypothetical protein
MRRLPVGTGGVLTLIAAIAFIAIWFSVLTGSRSLLGGDILYGCCAPWGFATGAHQPQNIMVGDPITQFLPWRVAEGKAVSEGHLPLWNPYGLHGVPLLATDVSATLSPFTLISLPFDPAWGTSLAMLLKLWVAGMGMALFLRALGVRPAAAAVAGIAYGTSSFVVIWLAWPQSSVAAIMPWAFAAAEWYFHARSPIALAAFAVAIAAQFLAGHAEASAQFGVFLVVYLAVRALAAGRAAVLLLGALGLAGLLGAFLSGIQLVPFLDEIRGSTLIGARGDIHAGLQHLRLADAASWLAPNTKGNPGIDALRGRDSNYNETTAFTGVGVVVLSPLSLLWGSSRRWSPVVGLATIGIVSAATVYGIATPVIGRLPLLDILPSYRFWIVTCFAVAAAGGLGLDALLARSGAALRPAPAILATIGTLGVAALAGTGVLFLRLGANVDHLLPSVRANIGFWLLVAALSLVVALAFVGAGLLRAPAMAVISGFAALALIEGALFAGPFNPRVPVSEVPPRSDAISWLQGKAGNSYIAATGITFASETPTLYGLQDAGGNEIGGLTPRLRDYWQLADPGYSDRDFRTQFGKPGVGWLAAAGVRYVMTPDDDVLPGTVPLHGAEHVMIAQVPDARPFAFVPSQVVTVSDESQARDWLALNGPYDPVVVERCCRSDQTPSSQPVAQVRIVRRDVDSVDLHVDTPSNATVVVLQSFWQGWVASVDGREVPIAPADLHFQAVDVPAGSHDVQLAYRPVNVVVGLAASGLGLVGVCLMAFIGFRRRRLRTI